MHRIWSYLNNSGCLLCKYSGDIDGRVPYTSNLYALKTMKLKVKTPWHPWLIDQQVTMIRSIFPENTH